MSTDLKELPLRNLNNFLAVHFFKAVLKVVLYFCVANGNSNVRKILMSSWQYISLIEKGLSLKHYNSHKKSILHEIEAFLYLLIYPSIIIIKEFIRFENIGS